MNTSDYVNAFIALFEALSWSVAIDSRFQQCWQEAPTNPSKRWSDGYAHGDTLKGVRFPRWRTGRSRQDSSQIAGFASPKHTQIGLSLR
jgi:hypothetical protein